MKIENGFIVGTAWHTGKDIMVAVHAVERIMLDCGNSPKADRIYLADGRGTIDILA
jgi:hypothetical protein